MSWMTEIKRTHTIRCGQPGCNNQDSIVSRLMETARAHFKSKGWAIRKNKKTGSEYHTCPDCYFKELKN